jgi:biotin carboxyl carrier protein
MGVGGYSLPSEVGGKTSAGQIRALMPGRITSILVKQGDHVKEGTPVLILEAMKMQNEIISPTSGKIRSIFVREGETVKRDSALIFIE